jgi:hypothetical protein
MSNENVQFKILIFVFTSISQIFPEKTHSPYGGYLHIRVKNFSLSRIVSRKRISEQISTAGFCGIQANEADDPSETWALLAF